MAEEGGDASDVALTIAAGQLEKGIPLIPLPSWHVVPIKEEGGEGFGGCSDLAYVYVRHSSMEGDIRTWHSWVSPGIHLDSNGGGRTLDYRAALFDTFRGPLGNAQSASSSHSSRAVVDSHAHGHGQTVAVDDGALRAPAGKSIGVDDAEQRAYKEGLPKVHRRLDPEYHSGLCRRLQLSLEIVARRARVVFESVVRRQSVSSEHVAQELSAWYKTSVRNPKELGRSPSVDGGLPSVGRAPDDVRLDGKYDCDESGYDDVFVKCFDYLPEGRQQLPVSTPLYSKFAGRMPIVDLRQVRGPIRLRNIRAGHLAIADRVHVGEVARCDSRTLVYNLEGRRTNTSGSALFIDGAHHVGQNYGASSAFPGSRSIPPLPSHVLLVYIDTCRLRWCSIGSVVFYSFVWPRRVREAKGIARTLFADHCNWAGVLVVRDRRFSSHNVCFRANRVLEHLLWILSRTNRPYIYIYIYIYIHIRRAMVQLVEVIQFRRGLRNSVHTKMLYNDVCQCQFVGRSNRGEVRYPQSQDWHHPSSFYRNVLGKQHQLFNGICRYLHTTRFYTGGCNGNTMNTHVAIKLVRAMVHVLGDVPPSALARGVPLFSAFAVRRNRRNKPTH